MDLRGEQYVRRYDFKRHNFHPALGNGGVVQLGAGLHTEDNLGVMMNLLAMVFSMCALLMKIKWAAWCSLLCALVGYTTAKTKEDSRQLISSVMLGFSAIIMTYMQNSGPLSYYFFPPSETK
jgi:hypothetical protein